MGKFAVSRLLSFIALDEALWRRRYPQFRRPDTRVYAWCRNLQRSALVKRLLIDENELSHPSNVSPCPPDSSIRHAGERFVWSSESSPLSQERRVVIALLAGDKAGDGCFGGENFKEADICARNACL